MTKLQHPFHFRTLGWLREKMDVNTRALATDAVRDPERARISGYVLPEDYRSVVGHLALMLLLCAGTVALASERAGLSPTLVHGLHVGALTVSVVAVLLFALDNWREHSLAREVDVIVQASAGGSGEVDVARLEQWHADARGQLWVISERGFTPDALAVARERGARCFTLRKHWIEEVRG